jgi:hypothetical protein
MSAAELSRWRATRRAFRGARFAALRRYWIAEGSRSIYLATSPISRDAMARGRGRIECVTMPHDYGHLLALGRRGVRYARLRVIYCAHRARTGCPPIDAREPFAHGTGTRRRIVLDGRQRAGASGGSIPARGRSSNTPQVVERWTVMVVSLNFASWNQLDRWLRQIEGLRRVA